MMVSERQVTLSEIAEVIRGVTFSKGEAFDDAFEDAVPILRAGNIGQELDTGNGLIWLPPEKVADVQRLQRGDIAICMSSGSQEVVGKTALLQHAWRGSVGAFCAIIRPKENEVEPEYLAFFLKTNAFRSWTRQSSGANIKNIRKSELEAFRLSLPPIEEQRRIVDILNRAASIERLKARASANLRDFIPALFLKMFGDPIENPIGWPTSSLGDLLQMAQYGSSKKADATDDAIPVLRMGNVSYDGYLDCSDLKYVDLPDAERDKYLLAKGDLLFNRTNSKELVGKTGMWDGRFTAIAASYFIRLRVEAELADPTYIWAFMNTASMKAKLFDMARGAIGQANINAKELQAITAPVPPLKTQRAFAKLVDAAVARSQLSETASGLAADLSRSLLDKLLGASCDPEAFTEGDARKC